MPIAERPPYDPNASPFVGDWYANADRTMWASGGGPVPGTLRTKVLWVRPVGSELTISARRLDGDAGPGRRDDSKRIREDVSGERPDVLRPGLLANHRHGRRQDASVRREPAKPEIPIGPDLAPAARRPRPDPPRPRRTAVRDRQDGTQVYRPGEGITLPRLVKEVKPKYTPEAMEARIQGSGEARSRRARRPARSGTSRSSNRSTRSTGSTMRPSSASASGVSSPARRTASRSPFESKIEMSFKLK